MAKAGYGEYYVPGSKYRALYIGYMYTLKYGRAAMDASIYEYGFTQTNNLPYVYWKYRPIL